MYRFISGVQRPRAIDNATVKIKIREQGYSVVGCGARAGRPIQRFAAGVVKETEEVSFVRRVIMSCSLSGTFSYVRDNGDFEKTV